MIAVTIKYIGLIGQNALKDELKSYGFTEIVKTKETAIVLPNNILFHANLLSINAANTVLSIAICRLNRAGITGIDMNKIEIKQFNIRDYSTSISAEGVVLR